MASAPAPATFTLRKVIQRALQLLVVATEDQSVDGPTVEDGLYTAIETLDAFNINGGLVLGETISTFDILAQQGVYTIGPDLTNGVSPPDFIIPTRPQYLTYAAFQPSTITPPVDLYVKIINAVEWGRIVSKEVGSGIPTQIYLDQTYPVGNIYLWNQPNQGGSLKLTYWGLLPSYSLTLDTVITNTFPPGFLKLLRFEIAQTMAMEFGKEMTVPVAEIINDLKRQITQLGLQSEWATYDSPTSIGVFDILSGTNYW